jgi:hypothetical protein
MNIFNIFKDRKHNKQLYKDGKANKNEVRLTTIGWRQDPIDEQDGQTEDCCNTPSGQPEYYKVIRRGRNGK